MKKRKARKARRAVGPATVFGPLDYLQALECIASLHANRTRDTRFYVLTSTRDRDRYAAMLSSLQYTDMFGTPASWQAPPQPRQEPPPLRTIAEAGRLLGFSRAHIYRLGYAGQLELKKVGARATRVTQKSIDRFLAGAPRLEQHREPRRRHK